MDAVSKEYYAIKQKLRSYDKKTKDLRERIFEETKVEIRAFDTLQKNRRLTISEKKRYIKKTQARLDSFKTGSYYVTDKFMEYTIKMVNSNIRDYNHISTSKIEYLAQNATEEEIIEKIKELQTKNQPITGPTP